MYVCMARLKSTPDSEQLALSICKGDWPLKADMSLGLSDVVWVKVSKRAIFPLNTVRAWCPSHTCNPDAHHVHQEISWEDAISMNAADFPS